MDVSHIRNFCIVAHIDHGKSTLADRLLELTHAVADRDMRAQYLDRMDLERERGITIKAQAVRLNHDGYELNLIDTPGHVDFTYEVSRSLEACEGAILLVDAAQGLEAQTLANFHLASDAGLTIVPAFNKIDLPAAEPDQRAKELADLLDRDPDDILRISAKTGDGVEDLLEGGDRARARRPSAIRESRCRALVFDSMFDPYRGVIASVRVKDGELPEPGEDPSDGDRRRVRGRGGRRHGSGAAPGRRARPGRGRLPRHRIEGRPPGEGRRHDHARRQARRARAVAGVPRAQADGVVGSVPQRGRRLLGAPRGARPLRLSDSALSYEPETSTALGFGFRVGFLGLLHMDIVKERLEREFDLELIATAPNVEFHVIRGDETIVVHNPAEMPVPGTYDRVEEPIVFATVITPKEYLGAVLDLCQSRRGELVDTTLPHAGAGRGALHAAPRRDRVRLLRPAEIQHTRLRDASTTSPGAIRSRTWSAWTSCFTASRWTRSARSCTARRPTRTGSR